MEWKGILILQRRVAVKQMPYDRGGQKTWPAEWMAPECKHFELSQPPEGDMAAWVRLSGEHLGSLFEDNSPLVQRRFQFSSHDDRFATTAVPVEAVEGTPFTANNITLLAVTIQGA